MRVRATRPGNTPARFAGTTGPRTFHDGIWRRSLAAHRAMLMSHGMKKRNRSSPFDLPIMIARLTAASWETVFHRSLMMAMGTCSALEYQRMATEKAAAAHGAMQALMTGASPAAVLAPYATRARANARRLRRKG